EGYRYGETLPLHDRTADSVGVSNVVEELIHDRQALGKNGVVVLTFIDKGGELNAEDLIITTKGFSEEKSDQDEHLEKLIRQNMNAVLGQVEMEDEWQTAIE